jgi:glycosyltransferase involved in cell wall biosynthesis
MRTSEIAIVIPLYNPHTGWELELDYSIYQLQHYFKNKDFLLIIVNDGSDKIIESEMHQLINKHPIIVYKHCKENKGKGNAIREGVKIVTSEYYIYTDWDFPFGQKIVFETFLLLSSKCCQLVIGKRTKSYFNSLPLFRRLISRSLQVTNYISTRFRVVDTQAGLKGMSNRAHEILLKTKVNGFIFELEFIRHCLKENIPYSFIDVYIEKDRKFSNFSWSILFKELETYFKILFEKE